MNLQTETLAKQAAEYAIEFATQDQALYIPKLMEKFAELIVRECMNAVCDPSTTYLESMTDASAMYTARERIRKHFRS